VRIDLCDLLNHNDDDEEIMMSSRREDRQEGRRAGDGSLPVPKREVPFQSVSGKLMDGAVSREKDEGGRPEVGRLRAIAKRRFPTANL
jgi:hypothetical protein